MKISKTFYASILLRLLLAMFIPLSYRYSIGVTTVGVAAYSMTWAMMDGNFQFIFDSALVALLLALIPIAFAVYTKMSSSKDHMLFLSIIAILLLFIPTLLPILHPSSIYLDWNGPIWLIPFGYSILLFVLFILLPAMAAKIRIPPDSRNRSLLLILILSIATFLLPIVFMFEHGLYAYDRVSIFSILYEVVAIRSGWTTEFTFSMLELKALGTLSPLTITAVILLPPRILFFLYTTKIVSKTFSISKTTLLGAVHEIILILLAWYMNENAIRSNYFEQGFVSIPMIFVLSVILVWLYQWSLKEVLSDTETYIAVPITYRIRLYLSNLKRKRSTST